MSTLENTKQKVVTLITCLEEIKTNAVHILRKLEPVMENLKNSTSDVVIQGIKKHPEYKENLQESMKNVAIEWVKDASAVKSEIDSFIKITEEGIMFETEKCSFLAEVWNGDAYDKSGIEGLQELNNDLKKQFSNITRENLYSLAAKSLKNES